MATIDWNTHIDNADDGGYDVLPKGEYRVKIVGVEVKTTQTGKPMYSVKTQVQDGPYKGRLVWTNMVVSEENPTAMSILIRHFGAIGLTADFLRTNPTEAQIADAMMERDAVVTVATTTYNGQERNEIKGWKRAASVPGATPPPPPASSTTPSAAPAPAPAPAPVPAASSESSSEPDAF